MNPAARRRTIALLGLMIMVVAGMAVGAVLLSRPSKTAPPPVKVPRLRGQTSAGAHVVLSSLGLRVRTYAIPAPGVAPGTVMRQAPAARAELPPGSRVTLYVAEVPRWRRVTSFSGDAGGESVPFRIRGRRWRIVYRMGYVGTCTFIFFCSGPSAKVATLGLGYRSSGFDLGEGQNQTQLYRSDPGIHQVTVSPGDDTARWSMTIEDYY